MSLVHSRYSPTMEALCKRFEGSMPEFKVLSRALLFIPGLAFIALPGLSQSRRMPTTGQRAELTDSQQFAAQPWQLQPPDFALWAESRIGSYRQSLEQYLPPPVAVLRIPAIQLETLVWEGTDDAILNRGAGLITGTARIDERGNMGIAGHRDGFFRRLKDLKIGDSMELVTQTRSETYVVDSFEIVDPENVGVLQSRLAQSLTLVTCYPFYFVGSAPQRYIVHASVRNSKPLETGGNDQTHFTLYTNHNREDSK
ncbi:MAG TPA: class D sortase [Terriglobales bacterium]|jgi:LPXTG-site transpeptidase (sortase) family protein|nr:class D sortase [Terriglobales bacterium]